MNLGAQSLDEVRVGLRTQSRHSMVRAFGLDYAVSYHSGQRDTLWVEALTIRASGSHQIIVDGEEPVTVDSIHMHSNTMMGMQIGHFVTRYYTGQLICKNYRHSVRALALVPKLDYLMGVVHAELGYLKHPELWKAQAVVANTWFQKNHGKFKAQGFQVTDDVRSQVFHGLPTDSLRLHELRGAVSRAEDYILVDSASPADGPIEALFHANSGGHTMDCGWYFSARPYLVSFPDAYSLDCKQTTWSKKLTLDQWTLYLARELGQSSSDSSFVHWATHIPLGPRGEYLTYKGHKVRLRKVREYYQLRSTWFSTRLDGAFVILEGRGYGHGIGMSQEGAHRMAMLGFTFEEILEFYYPHTLIVPVG